MSTTFQQGLNALSTILSTISLVSIDSLGHDSMAVEFTVGDKPAQQAALNTLARDDAVSSFVPVCTALCYAFPHGSKF